MNKQSKVIHGHIVDVLERRIFPGALEIDEAGMIASVAETSEAEAKGGFLLPGFVDAHVHVESSMVLPGEFARCVVPRGTLAAMVDPHEVANVLGEEGVREFFSLGGESDFVWGWGVPSCVPATLFESAGAVLDAEAVERLLQDPRVTHLSEMMDVPGVLKGNAEVMRKLAAAQRLGKRVDGHAPCMLGADLQRYIDAGIGTDHESDSVEEAREKLSRGMRVMLRRGSAARMQESFLPLLSEFRGKCMWCCDDLHPTALMREGIVGAVRWAVKKGVDVWDVLEAATVTPVKWYGLKLGLLRKGDRADFLRVSDLQEFEVEEAWLKGKCMARWGETNMPTPKVVVRNCFHAKPVRVEDLQVETRRRVRVIGVREGLGITDQCIENVGEPGAMKLVVLNRYVQGSRPAVGFARGFGEMGDGALAISVAHDSHNLIAVGGTDKALATALNAVVGMRGGLAVAQGERVTASMSLPYAGLMSTKSVEEVAREERACLEAARRVGVQLRSPFMVLSFLSLPVIPTLRLTDCGLFNAESFTFVNLDPDA